MVNKYLFKMGNIETYVYDEFVHQLADSYDGVLRLETIKNAIKVLEEYGNKYYFQMDALSLLMYFIEKEGVDTAVVVEKSKGL